MHTSIRFVAAFLVVALAIGGLASSRPAAAAVGGPVIIGGDDLTDHGSISGTTLQNGWLYIRRALENIAPNVTRTNDGSVAAIGSAASSSTSGNAGAAIGYAAPQAGLTVTYYEGATAITGFFTALAAGTANPKIIWISGTGASNDLDSAESAALNANATRIADFVNSGGGLMSHGSEYGWLFALLPGLSSVNSGSSGDLELTAAGTAAFPGVTNSNINAGPWHNHFEGNFGGLQILAVSNNVDDSQTGERAAVIIGGAAVTLPSAITLTPGSATNPVGTSHTVTATVRDQAGAPRAQQTVTFTVTAGPNTGATGTGVTNASGQATFTYTSNGTAGTDTITASFFDSSNETIRSDTATKTWAGATPPSSRAVVTATSPTCGQAVINATGVTPGLPHQIVVTPSTGGSTAFVVDVTALADGKVTATITTGGGTFFAFVRLASNQVTVSNTAIFTVAACAVATPTPTPTPTATPAPTPTPALTPTPTAAPIAQLPSTGTGGDSAPSIALAALAALALGAIVWRKRYTRT
jgi:hypothetical protein